MKKIISILGVVILILIGPAFAMACDCCGTKPPEAVSADIGPYQQDCCAEMQMTEAGCEMAWGTTFSAPLKPLILHSVPLVSDSKTLLGILTSYFSPELHLPRVHSSAPLYILNRVFRL